MFFSIKHTMKQFFKNGMNLYVASWANVNNIRENNKLHNNVCKYDFNL